MAKKCPNISSPEWKELVLVLGNSSIRAFDAYEKNGEEIPDVNSDIVQDMKESNLNFGPKVDVILDDEGNQTDEYKDESGNLYGRVSRFIHNFAKRKIDRTKTNAERKAEREWEGTPRDEKRVTQAGVAQSYEEYLDWLTSKTNLAIAKGNIMHWVIEGFIHPEKADEMSGKISDLLEKTMEEEGKIPTDWKWITEGDAVPKILDNLGVNYFYEFNDPMDDVLRDEVYSEVSVALKELALAGTIDTLVRHSDNTYTVIDWKSGNSLNTIYKGMSDILMKYGSQSSMDIEDSVRNRAKLQIAMYTVLLRANNPGMQVRDMKIGWIPNKYDSLHPDIDAVVDPEAFIPMIEQFFGDPKLLEELGFPADLKSKLLELDPTIFDPRKYSSTPNIKSKYTEDISSLKGKEKLAYLTKKLTLTLGGVINITDLDDKTKKEAENLVDEINRELEEPGRPIEGTLYEDLSMMELYLGNYSEMNHPMIQSWKRFSDSRKDDARKVINKKINKFESILQSYLEEYYKQNKIIKIAGNRALNYDDLYKWMYIEEIIDDEVSQTKERLLTNSETDSALKSRYEALSSKQKKLLNYVNEVFEGYFSGENAYLNETAAIINGKELTHVDLYNKEKKPRDKRTWTKGFFFKLPPSDADIVMREGNGKWVKGMFSAETLKKFAFKYSTYFREQYYERWDDKQAMPIKYLGNDYIDASRSYTKNIEIIFKQGIEEMERKKYLDPVISLGKGIVNKLAAEKNANGEPAYERLVERFDMALLTDLQRKMKIKNPKGKTRGVRIPMVTPNGTEYHRVSVDAVMRGMMKWASMNTMWIRPWQGIGNGLHAMMLTHRDGLKGSISKIKLLGISGNSVDYTEKDIARADALYFSDFAYNAIRGDMRKSKIYQLGRELDVFGDEFTWFSMEKTMLSMRNRYMQESTLYMFHSVPEEMVSLTTMVAQLLHMKNEKTGHSLYDDYSVVETVDSESKKKIYELKWNGGVRGVVQRGAGTNVWQEQMTALTSEEMAKIRKVHERLQGGYRRDEMTYIEAYVFGKLFIQLKKYYPRLVINALHKKRTETDLGAWEKLMDPKTGQPILTQEDGTKMDTYEWVRRVTEGRWVTLGSHLMNLATLGRAYQGYENRNLTDEQKQNLIEAALTMTILIGMYSIYLSAFGDLDDDDTTKKWFRMYLVDNLSQQYNPVDLMRTVKTLGAPVSVAKLINFAIAGTEMVAATTSYAIGNEDAGFTKKGDLRGWNQFVKGIPLLAQYKDITNRFKNVKDEESWINIGIETLRLK